MAAAGVISEQLRDLIQDCLSKHMYRSAVFYADKLVCLAPKDPANVYLLAQALYVSQQYRRSLVLLKQEGLVETDVRFRYLAAQCLCSVAEWEECLSLLGEGNEDEPFQFPPAANDTVGEIRMEAAVYLLRGRVYEAMENRPRAIHWYSRSLAADPMCFEAFDALVSHYMLSAEAEHQMVSQLTFPPGYKWLHVLLQAHCNKHMQQDSIEEKLDWLEGLPAQTAPAPLQESPLINNAPCVQSSPGSREAAAHARKSSPPHPGPGSGPARGLSSVPAPTIKHSVEEHLPDRALARTRDGQDASGAAEGAKPGVPGSAPTSDTPVCEMLVDSRAADVPAAEPSGRDALGEAPLVVLQRNVDVLTCRADWQYHSGRYRDCHELTGYLLQKDPYAIQCLPVHLASALQLQKKNDLFLRAHKLVEEYPKRALSWFAVGCYYMCIKQFDSARRYFGKATSIQQNFAPAWLGFGDAFAAQDESDQALAAYRTAARLFPGLHQPVLGMAREYMRMNSLQLSEQMLLLAHSMCPGDAHVAAELGVLYYQQNELPQAASWLRHAIDQAGGISALPPSLEPLVANLGHVLRKQQQYDAAIEMFEKALGLRLGVAGTYLALAFAQHLKGSLDEAVHNYHRALALRPDDAFATQMLHKALEEQTALLLPDLDSGLVGIGL